MKRLSDTRDAAAAAAEARPTIDLVYFDAGGGHRAAATALVQAAERQGRPWRLRPLNLTRVLDPESSFRRITGFEPEDYYNARLKRGWTLGLAQELKVLQAMIRLAHGPMVRALQAHWRRTRPAMVVSLVPNFNRALHAACTKALDGARFATVMTDLADLPRDGERPSRFWIEPSLSPQWLVCGTPRAAEQARAAGLPPGHVREVSGMILRPAFHDAPEGEARAQERAAQRAELGLPADASVGLVMFGGHGSLQMLKIARRLPEVPLIFVCGHNAALAAELRELGPDERRAPHAVIGFTSDVPRLMRAADFFIGKPGPGSLSEALHCGLPAITIANAATMPQERYNVQWLRENGYGDSVTTTRALPAAVARLLADMPAARERVARYRNRAVFEVLDVLDGLIGEAMVEARLDDSVETSERAPGAGTPANQAGAGSGSGAGAVPDTGSGRGAGEPG